MSNRSAPIFYVTCQPEGAGLQRLDLTDRVLSFAYEDNEKKADLLKLTVDNWDLSNFDDPVWKAGNKLIVTWGYPGNMAPPRTCIIQKVTGSVQLSVEAQGQAVLMNKEVHNRTFENVQRSELVHSLAKEYGYDDEHRFIEETTEVYDMIVQGRATDAQLIKRLADAEGFEFYVDWTGFHWHPRRLAKKPLRVLQWYLPPGVGDILAFNVENDVFAKPGKVKAKGRDPLNKKDVTGEASNGETERPALQPVTEGIIDPITGVVTLQTTIASEETKPTTETSSAQAKKEADGAYKRSVQTTVKIDLDHVGDPQMLAKSVIELRGISKRLSGLYYVNQINHTIDSGGYKCKSKVSTDGTQGHSESLVSASGASGGPAGAGRADPAAIEASKARLVALQGELVEYEAAGFAPPAGMRQEFEAEQKKYAALTASQSKAQVNDKRVTADTDPDKLAMVQKQVLDEATGETTTVTEFHDMGGADAEDVNG